MSPPTERIRKVSIGLLVVVATAFVFSILFLTGVFGEMNEVAHLASSISTFAVSLIFLVGGNGCGGSMLLNEVLKEMQYEAEVLGQSSTQAENLFNEPISRRSTRFGSRLKNLAAAQSLSQNK